MSDLLKQNRSTEQSSNKNVSTAVNPLDKTFWDLTDYHNTICIFENGLTMAVVSVEKMLSKVLVSLVFCSPLDTI